MRSAFSPGFKKFLDGMAFVQFPIHQLFINTLTLLRCNFLNYFFFLSWFWGFNNSCSFLSLTPPLPTKNLLIEDCFNRAFVLLLPMVEDNCQYSNSVEQYLIFAQFLNFHFLFHYICTWAVIVALSFTSIASTRQLVRIKNGNTILE